MRHPDETDPMTPFERRRAIARILAAGVLRLGARAALPDPATISFPKILTESGPNCLEVLPETRLTVHDG
jgi:hypothetical protein